MDANFYDHFKNKDLKNMFKRLCTQNQQKKFNTLWQMLDQLTAELVKVRASGTSTSQPAEARDSIEKPFSHWIRALLENRAKIQGKGTTCCLNRY